MIVGHSGFFIAEMPTGVEPGDPIAIVGTEAHHAGVVRRLEPGEIVTLTDGLGSGALAQVESVSRSEVSLKVTCVLQCAEPALKLTVVQAIPKPDRGLLAVDLMTEAGVDQIIAWAANRSQIKWTTEKTDKALAKWTATAREASKQSRRLRFPIVGPKADTAQVASMIAKADYAIIMHESATRSIAEAVVPDCGSILIVIGPEGGLTDDEVHQFEQAGGQTFLMGPTVLRTSTAGALALTQVRLLAQLANKVQP